MDHPHHSFPYFDPTDNTHLYRDNDRFDFDSSDLRQLFNLLGMNRVSQLKQDQSYFSELGFPFFDPIDEHLGLWDCWGDGDLPLLTCNADHVTCGETKITGGGDGDGGGDQGGRRRSWKPLEFEEIEKHFEMPIAVAAGKLGVGLTMLKKRCRELNIKRWPHRKLKSIKSLIQNVKEMGSNEDVEMLEEQKRMIKKQPEIEFTQRTKKLRQACFKASYNKKRRFDSLH